MDSIKLILLKTGTYVISYLTEMEMEPSVFLSDPKEVVDGETVTLRPFPRHSGQRNVLLYSDFLATIVDPDPILLKQYQESTPTDDEELLQ
jgi:hypothetical protein